MKGPEGRRGHLEWHQDDPPTESELAEDGRFDATGTWVSR